MRMKPAPSLDMARDRAPAARVMQRLLRPRRARAWWQVAHSVTTPRVLGPFAIEWPPAEFRDELLGRLGGVFRGTIDALRARARASSSPTPSGCRPTAIRSARWRSKCQLQPRGQTARPRVRVTQNGFEESARWRRYYEVIEVGWDRALASLKTLLEA